MTAHLAAHDNRCQMRNANYRRIMQELSLGQKVPIEALPACHCDAANERAQQRTFRC